MNAREIRFTVEGQAVGQQRTGACVVNGHAKVYEQKKSRGYKTLIREKALQVRRPALLEGAISLTVKEFRMVPKSFSAKKRQLALAGVIRPTTKPDWKNLFWAVEDSLNQIIWRDDSQVVDPGESGKWYGEPPRVEVVIRCLDEQQERLFA
ncbi:MAG TPA: RusA family crossover junction endodeoxyribonuclease [Bacillota bacterium]|jgi:Holliday junction resolvase RusA-like endonuclease